MDILKIEKLLFNNKSENDQTSMNFNYEHEIEH